MSISSDFLLLLSLVFAYIYISQGSVETHLLCGRIHNNHIRPIANYLLSVPFKNFENRSIIGKDVNRSIVPRFYGPRCKFHMQLAICKSAVQNCVACLSF